MTMINAKMRLVGILHVRHGRLPVRGVERYMGGTQARPGLGQRHQPCFPDLRCVDYLIVVSLPCRLGNLRRWKRHLPRL